MKKFFSLLLISAICSFVQAQTWQDTVAIIEKAFGRFKPENPGLQVAISRNGNIIFSKAWGMANLEHNAPLTTESVIEAGSVSKQFTAAAILLLEQQGKLSLNDDVRKHLPEMPGSWKRASAVRWLTGLWRLHVTPGAIVLRPRAVEVKLVPSNSV